MSFYSIFKGSKYFSFFSLLTIRVCVNHEFYFHAETIYFLLWNNKCYAVQQSNPLEQWSNFLIQFSHPPSTQQILIKLNLTESSWFGLNWSKYIYACCCSVTQPCPTLCDPMYCSMPGFPVHHQLLEPTQIHVHRISDAIHLILCRPFSSCLQSSASGSFPSIGVSASASVLPMDIQDWFPLGWTGWISLQSKGLSRVFSNTTIQKHQFFGA